MPNRNDVPHFARGISGPLGKLDRDLKTKVDEYTDALFRQHCALRGTDVATMLRNFVYASVHQKTYRQMVLEKLNHEAQYEDALHKLIGPFGGPESGETGEVA
jgi:hypothetical protein